jgi:pyochelin biosynthetic protein PchC
MTLWLRRHPRSWARCRLLCFPFAGVGARVFAPWHEMLPEDIELQVLRYPGRDERATEPGVPDMATMIDTLACEVLPRLVGPVVLFGHSMGAAIAYEFARRAARDRPDVVAGLVVSGRQGPEFETEGNGDVHRRDDEGVIDDVVALGGADRSTFDDPDLRALVLPAIRNDYRLIERYQPAAGPPLTVPILAMTGREDPRMSLDLARSWLVATTADFQLAEFPGGHFFLESHRRGVVSEVATFVSACVGTPVERIVSMSTSQLPDPFTVTGLRADIAQLLGRSPDEVDPEGNLLVEGLDSIKIMMLSSRWQQHDVEVEFAMLVENPTITAWSRLLRALYADAPARSRSVDRPG